MGTHHNIAYDKYPEQGSLLQREVRVCFNYDTSQTLKAKCIRNDVQEPYVTAFLLEDVRVILAAECMYSSPLQ